MPRVKLTSHLSRYVTRTEFDVESVNVREALETVFISEPALRGYIMDDQSVPRKHVAILVNDSPVSDRQELTDAVETDDTIHVLQALSGG